MAQRARWTTRYERGLVEILGDHRFAHYRGQNGWCSEGWNKIAKEFNSLFPDANFTKGQIQDKEAQLKKDYKAIKSIRSCSRVSWNHSASVINTTAEIWDEIIEEDSRLRRYENKSFPLFDSLDLLYQGQIAEGRHCFTSSKAQNGGSKSFEAEGTEKTVLDFTKRRPWDTGINVGDHDGEAVSSAFAAIDDYGRQELESHHVDFQGKEKESSHMMMTDSRQRQLRNERQQYKGQNRRSSRQRMENSAGKSLGTEHHDEPVDLSDDDDADFQARHSEW